MIVRAAVTTAVRFGLALLAYGGTALAWHAADRTGPPPLAGVVVLTVAVAALLWCTHAPLDRLAARVAFGRRGQGITDLDDVLRRMSDSLPVEQVLPRLAQALGRDRERAEVQLWLADGSRWAEVWPPEAPDDDGAVHVAVVHGGVALGELGVGVGGAAMSPFDRRLLDDLAGAAGVAMSTLRLTVELQRREAQLVEINQHLAASSDRMRAAREVQQRRMRAELAGMVLPHVDAAAAACRAGEGLAGREQAQRALDQLRRISHGLHPPRLTEDGVVASVHGWLERTGRATTVDAADPLDDLDAPVAAGVYFIAVTLVEALDATELLVRRSDGFELLVRGVRVVQPDLVTLAQDRAETFGGRVHLSAPATVTCRVPADVREGAGSP
jgi:hypothetical protein